MAGAHEWVRSHVAVTGAIEQPHVQWWSTVLRAPTSDAPVWFKAVVEGGGKVRLLFDRVTATISLAIRHSFGRKTIVPIDGVDTSKLVTHLWDKYRIVIVAIGHDNPDDAKMSYRALRVTPKVRSSPPTASCRLAWLNSTLACSTWGLRAARRPLPAAGSP